MQYTIITQPTFNNGYLMGLPVTINNKIDYDINKKIYLNNIFDTEPIIILKEEPKVYIIKNNETEIYIKEKKKSNTDKKNTNTKSKKSTSRRSLKGFAV